MNKLMKLLAVVALLGFSQTQYVKAFQGNAEIVLGDVKYEEIDREELPEAVNEAFTKDYSEYTFKQAYKGDDGNYKIKAKMEDTKHYFIYDPQGTLVKSGKMSDKKDKKDDY